MKRLACVAALAALLGATSSAAAAVPDLRVIGTGGAESVWTDGDRYAAVTLSGRAMRVIDERTGRRWRVTPPAGCTFDAVAAGQILWSCPDGFVAPYPTAYTEKPLLQTLGSSTTRPVPGWDTYVDWYASSGIGQGGGSGPEPDALGSHWLRGHWSCYRCGLIWSYVNLRTGRFVERVDESATRLIDLDEADLEVPVCAPLRRATADPNFIGPYHEPATYRPPWFLADLQQEGRPRIRVHRCGRKKPLIAGRCVSRSCDVRLGRRHLVWLDRSAVRAFDLVTRRRWIVGKVKPVRELFSLHLTRHRAYVVPYSGGDVQVAPLRRR